MSLEQHEIDLVAVQQMCSNQAGRPGTDDRDGRVAGASDAHSSEGTTPPITPQRQTRSGAIPVPVVPMPHPLNRVGDDSGSRGAHSAPDDATSEPDGAGRAVVRYGRCSTLYASGGTSGNRSTDHGPGDRALAREPTNCHRRHRGAAL